jgi:ABC-type transporter Mla subunit MlaD
MRHAVLLAVLLAGCALQQSEATYSPKPPALENTGTLDRMESKQDQTNQNLTGLGAQIRELNASLASVQGDLAAVKGDVSAFKLSLGQVNGDVAGVKGDVAALKGTIGEINTKLDVSFTVKASIGELKNEMSATMELKDVKAQLAEQVKVTAKLADQVAALASAQGQAVVGWNNKLDETVKTITAGGNVSTTDMSKEVKEVIERGYASNEKIMYLACALLVAILGGGGLTSWLVKKRFDKVHGLLEPVVSLNKGGPHHA